MKYRPQILLLVLMIFCSSFAGAAEKKELKQSEYKTKFAANLAMWWKKMPFLDKLDEAKKLGFKGIEFWGYDKLDIPAIAKKCKELDLDVVQFTAWGKPLGSGKYNDEFEAGIKKAIEVAKTLNCKMMTVTGHRVVKGGPSVEEQLKNYAAAMKRVAPLCEKAGVMIIVEPFNPVDHGVCLLNGSKEALKICRDINSPMIKINWDFYHMQLTEGALLTHLKNGMDQVGYLQLADTPGRNQPGTGELNYKVILKQAYELGYRGYIGVECRPKGKEAEALQQLLENSY